MPEIVDFPQLSLMEITKRLRKLADQLDAGDLPRPETIVCVSINEEGIVSVFGFGEADPMRSYWLLHQGIRSMDL